MSTSSPRRSAPALKSLRPPPRLRPAQAAPVRRGQPAAGEGIPGRGATGGCAPACYCSQNNAICGEGFCNYVCGAYPFAGGDEE